MSTPVRVAAYVVALVAVFAAALGVGRLAGPIDVAAAPPAHEDATHDDAPQEDAAHDDAAHDEATPDADPGTAAPDVPGGLMVSSQGYTLALDDTALPAGDRVPLRFRVLGPDGAPVTSYDVEHEKRLHLIVVRRDFRGYQHLHPTLADDGTWAVDLALVPGTWRVLADFTPTGAEGLTLGADVSVAGRVGAAEPDGERSTDRVDGYTVSLVGDLVPGTESGIGVTVTRGGEVVTDLEPYLGADGHLVALREGDLAYLHVHPVEADSGARVPFVIEVPSVGRYRLFFDFSHGGVVRTASFVVGTEGSGSGEGASHDH